MKQGGFVGLLVLGLAIAVYGVFAWSASNDRELDRVSNCVVATAKAQGYSGNVYSKEAWDIFAPSCAK